MMRISERLYTADQVRQLDSSAIDGHGIPGYELMSRAGRAVFHQARRRFPEASRWLILCGGGNNGGDGYVVARLAREAGIEVSIRALKAPAELEGDAATAADDWHGAGGNTVAWAGDRAPEPELVVDALFGTGLDRDVEGDYRDAIRWLNALGCRCVSVDVPSGLNADSGNVMGVAVKANLTVTFIGLKRGLFTGDGPDHAGDVVFDALDTPREIHRDVKVCGRLLDRSFLGRHVTPRPLNSHKGTFGHVLVIGGNRGMSGAARLAAEAALRTGAGLVTVATHPGHAAWMNLARPELMVHGVAEPADLEPLLEHADALAVGPGLGQDEWARAVLASALDFGLPAVVDADGINLLASGSAVPRRDDWILTPHPAEAARLLGVDTHQVQSDRFESALRIAERFSAEVLLKGCGSVLASPDGAWSLCPLGNPGMATGGSGDVLTGVVASMLAQGHAPPLAGRLAAVAHGAAGDLAARRGEHGMIATDIIDALRDVLNG